MKTEQEIHEADKQELEIAVKKKAANEAAYLEFNKVTREAFEEYTAVWRPAKEKWEAFSRPHAEGLRAALTTANKAEELALAEVRKDWQTCPRCGTSANRYQIHCTDDECGINLLTYAPKEV